jgi:hypothetical protein
VSDALTQARLRERGAITAELVHGMTEVTHQHTVGRTSTSLKAVWSLPEADELAPSRPSQRMLGGFMPAAAPSPPVVRVPVGARPVNVLVASSYWITGWSLDPRLTAHYQEPFLRQARELGALAVNLRWRPHPGDDPEAVARMCAAFPELERSRGSVDDDLRWADVLATSVSSLIMEALDYQLPVFVHETPRWDDAHLEVFAGERRFGLAQTLLEALAPCLDALRRGDPALLEPERALRRRLLGPEGQPADVAVLCRATTGT